MIEEAEYDQRLGGLCCSDPLSSVAPSLWLNENELTDMRGADGDI